MPAHGFPGDADDIRRAGRDHLTPAELEHWDAAFREQGCTCDEPQYAPKEEWTSPENAGALHVGSCRVARLAMAWCN
jgi:hypothetical protein